MCGSFLRSDSAWPLNIKAPSSFETSVIIYRSSRPYIADDLSPLQHRCENLIQACQAFTYPVKGKGKGKGKGKAVPLQAWSGPEGSRKLR